MDRVFISKPKSLAREVDIALSFLDLDPFSSILVKPNFFNSSPSSSGTTTDLSLVREIVRSLSDSGKKVMIGESSGGERTEDVFRKLGLSSFDAELINFDTCERVDVTSPTGYILKSLSIPKPALDCDLILSVPKIKTHASTLVSLGVKNSFALIPFHQRQIAHLEGLDKAIVDVFSFFADKYRVLVDALVGLEGPLGPTSGAPVPLGLLISGKNAVRADAACCRVMGVSPEQVPHLAIAKNAHLGDFDFQVVGSQIETVRRPFRMPPFFMPSFFSIAGRFFRRLPYLSDPGKCSSCERCAKACPKKAISMAPGPKFDYSKCASCLLCVEMCRNGALSYKRSNRLLFSVARKFASML